MDDFPRQKLCEIIALYGSTIYEDRRRLEGLLADMCGEYRREINVLIGALKERVPEDLLNAPEQMPPPVLFGQLTQRLQDNLGLTNEAARWAIETWATCLGVDVPAQAAKVMPPTAPLSISIATTELTAQASNFIRPYIEQIRLTWALMFDPRMPIVKKLIPIIAVAYAISPIGIFIALVPILGPLADLGVFLLALFLFNRSAPADVLNEHMMRIRGTENSKNRKPVDKPPAKPSADGSPTNPPDPPVN